MSREWDPEPITNVNVMDWWRKGHTVTGTAGARWFFIFGTDRHLAPSKKPFRSGAIWRHLAPSVAIWRQIWLAPDGATWRLRQMAIAPDDDSAIWRHMAMTTDGDSAIWRHLAIVPDTPTYEHVPIFSIYAEIVV